MNTSEAFSTDYTSLITKLKAENRLAPLKAPAYDPVPGHFVVVDLVVDLEQAYRQAVSQKARTLSVFADIVNVPETFNHTLSDDLRLLSVVARSIQVQGARAIVRLKYAKDNNSQPVVRILADEIEGEFLVYVADQAEGKKPLAAAAKTEPLRFNSYTCTDQGLVKTQGKLQLDLLDLATPLYQVLTASFDFTAGAMRKGNATPEMAKLASSILKWLVRWAAYPSPYLARLFENAQALSQLTIVTNENSQIVYNIPPRTPDDYLALAHSQKSVAEKYELDESFKNVQNTIKEVVGRVVTAWIARDSADLDALDEEIKHAKELTDSAKKAVEKAAKELENQKFDAAILGIKFEGALAEDRILKIVKVTFEILQGIVQLGVSVASIGANPGLGGAISSINPFTWLNSAGALGGQAAPLSMRLGATALLLYALPYSVYKEYKSMDADDKKQLTKDVKSMGPGISKLLGAAMTLIKIDNPLKLAVEIGDLVSHAAGVPDTIESKAIWESFEAEAVNQLEIFTRDPDATAAIVNATIAYKTCIQKFAIYGRLYSEQQALLAQRIRELGTLQIRRAAAEKKQETLQALQGDLSNRDQVVELMGRLRDGRLYELRQTFFAALCKFRAAYFYENLEWPAKMPSLVVPANAGEMNELLNDITTAQQGSASLNPGDFTKVKEIKKSERPDFFADLQNHKEAKFQITPSDDKLFDGHYLVRLSKVRVRLVGARQTLVTVDLLSDTGFQDRLSSIQALSFSGNPVFISFEYNGDVIEFDSQINGVRPTPFTTWTLNVKGSDLALDKVTQVNVELIGKSLKKSG